MSPGRDVIDRMILGVGAGSSGLISAGESYPS